MNTSSRRVIVHIGAPKTGTTMLQNTFFTHRDKLAQHGVLYPDVNLRGYGHHDLAFLLAGGYPEWATAQDRTLRDLTADMTAAVRAHDGDILLSSENFYLFPAPAALDDWLRETGIPRDTIRIVVYVRRQDDALESWYNQTVKAQGSTLTFDECRESIREIWDYDRQLSAWSDVFGSAAMIVRPYESERYAGGSLVSDFFHSVGIDGLRLTVPPERINSGLNRDVLEFQRLTNRLPLSVQEKRRFHRQLIALTSRTAGSGLFDETPLLVEEQRREILAEYAASNAAVARRYLGRETLFATAPTGNGPVAGSTGLTMEKLVYIVGWLISVDKDNEGSHAAK